MRHVPGFELLSLLLFFLFFFLDTTFSVTFNVNNQVQDKRDCLKIVWLLGTTINTADLPCGWISCCLN